MVNCLSVGRARGFEAVEILGQRLVIRVVRVGLDGGDDRVGRNEAGDVVHVAVRVVAGDAAVQPDHLIDAEIVVRRPAQAARGSRRDCAAGLRSAGTLRSSAECPARWCRWTRLRARSSGDRPASQSRAPTDEVRAAPIRGPEAGRRLCQSSYLAQALKCQLVMATWPSRVAHEDRARVPRPHAIRRPLMEETLSRFAATRFRMLSARAALPRSARRCDTRSRTASSRTISA